MHTSDWLSLVRVFCCIQISVSKRECSNTISPYSIWPAPVARGNTPGIAFSFCQSYFLIRGCAVVYQSSLQLSPLKRPPSPSLLHHRPTQQSLLMTALWSHTLHFTLLIHSARQKTEAGYKTYPHAEWTSQRVPAESKCWRLLYMTLEEAEWKAQQGRS